MLAQDADNLADILYQPQGTVSLNIVEMPLRHADARPDALAAMADGEQISYRQLCSRAGQLGSWLIAGRMRRVAILASRSIGAFVGVLGTAWAGAAYVPLSLKAPSSRLADMLRQSSCDLLLIDRHGAKLFDDSLAGAAPPFVVAADEEARQKIRTRGRQVPLMSDLTASAAPPATISPEQDAYIIFTSGTTGSPKGVIISYGARHALIRALEERYQLGPDDRIAETTDLSWDLSVANMIFAWQYGGALYALPAESMVAPTRFIRANAITVWLSVPSVITTMMRLGALKPDIFPSLRYSFFAGEGLPSHAAAAWQAAAPTSIIENLYGPTEATFTCIGHRVVAACSTHEHVMVPIGKPYTSSAAAIIGPDDQFLPAGQKGELILAGPQLATGYLERGDLTHDRFPVIKNRRWYRTGDAAYCDEDGVFHHLGRIDNQLKVLGYRVELEDVESQLRAVSGAIEVAVIGWPYGAPAVDRLLAFVVGGNQSAEELQAALSRQLPSYMVPRSIYQIDAMPRSENGKLNRALLQNFVPDPASQNA